MTTKSGDYLKRGKSYHSSRFSRLSNPSSTFMPWKWIYSREIGSPCFNGETNNLHKSFYSSVKGVNTWDPKKTVSHNHHGGIFNFDFSTDGSLLVAACQKQSILMFDPFNGKLIGHKNNAHQDCVNCVRFLDTRIFATCSDDATVALWDVRNLKQHIRTLEGHSNWVKNIEYATSLGLLVTSGFDGSIYTWDITNYSEEMTYKKVFYSNSLMRSKLTPDNTKLIITTTGGFLVIIHDLDLSTLGDDLGGFEPNIYRLLQLNSAESALSLMYNRVFERKRNRVEMISDFPSENQAEVIASLQVHPQGWCVVSRNTSADENTEWTCTHNIQELLEEESSSTSSTSHETQSAAANSEEKEEDYNNGDTQASASADNHDHYLSNLNILSRNLLSSGIRRFGQVLHASDMDEDTDHDFSQFPSLEMPIEDRLLGTGGLIIPRGGNSLYTTISDSEEESDSSSSANSSNRGDNTRDLPVLNREAEERDIVNPPHFPNTFILPNFRPLRSARRAANRTVNSFSNKIHQNKPRLLHYIDEPNVGKGFIKELCFSTDGRIVCSPFGNGVRLLAFNSQCQELCDCVPSRPMKLTEVGCNISHSNVVVTTKFSPVHFMYVSGCLGGVVVFHQPVL